MPKLRFAGKLLRRVPIEDKKVLGLTGVHRSLENAHPPRTTLGHEAEAYGKVLGGCVVL